MIKIDFPIKDIKFGFNIVGQSFLMCTWNGEVVPDGKITADKIKDKNILSISFAKIDPADEESFATLQYFLINDGSFKNQIETQQITVDKIKHPDAQETSQFNGYFGYVSRLDVTITQDTSLLKQAAWIIADNEFEYIKWPFKGNKHRAKTFTVMQNLCTLVAHLRIINRYQILCMILKYQICFLLEKMIRKKLKNGLLILIE